MKRVWLLAGPACRSVCCIDYPLDIEDIPFAGNSSLAISAKTAKVPASITTESLPALYATIHGPLRFNVCWEECTTIPCHGSLGHTPGRTEVAQTCRRPSGTAQASSTA